MMQTDRRWNVVTILLQSVVLFFAVFLLCVLPHLLNDTYERMFEGKALPAMTQWVRDVGTDDAAGVLCVALGAALTNLCVGLMLIATAATALAATQRTIFLATTTWGIVLLVTLLLLVALTLPFISTVGRLSTEEGTQAAVVRSRKWIICTALYCIALVGTTALTCVKKGKVEQSARP